MAGIWRPFSPSPSTPIVSSLLWRPDAENLMEDLRVLGGSGVPDWWRLGSSITKWSRASCRKFLLPIRPTNTLRPPADPYRTTIGERINQCFCVQCQVTDVSPLWIKHLPHTCSGPPCASAHTPTSEITECSLYALQPGLVSHQWCKHLSMVHIYFPNHFKVCVLFHYVEVP